jgi:colanic acid biosynthesis protein WcaH
MIPTQLYQQILEHMPIVCMDFVLMHNGKVLLTYRDNEPAKNQWWIQGGRVLKNETLIDAVHRKAKQEIGISVKIIKKIGAYEFFDENSNLPEVKTGVHSLAACFLVMPCNEDDKIKFDTQHSKLKWIDHVEEDLHQYVKDVLSDSKVFEDN